MQGKTDSTTARFLRLVTFRFSLHGTGDARNQCLSFAATMRDVASTPNVSATRWYGELKCQRELLLPV